MFSKTNAAILGIGTDIIDVRRIEVALARHTSARFISRIYTPAEIVYCEAASHPERRLLRYANRFAAKEAGYKALGVGRGAAITWQDIETVSPQGETSGPPSLLLHGKAKQVMEERVADTTKTVITHLSLSDEYPYAVAFVVLSLEERPIL